MAEYIPATIENSSFLELTQKLGNDDRFSEVEIAFWSFVREALAKGSIVDTALADELNRLNLEDDEYLTDEETEVSNRATDRGCAASALYLINERVRACNADVPLIVQSVLVTNLAQYVQGMNQTMASAYAIGRMVDWAFGNRELLMEGITNKLGKSSEQ